MSEDKEKEGFREKPPNKYNLRSKNHKVQKVVAENGESEEENVIIRRMQQPSVYINTHLMKIKMETDYVVPVKVESNVNESSRNMALSSSSSSLPSSSSSFSPSVANGKSSKNKDLRFKCCFTACPYAGKTKANLKIHLNIHKEKTIACKKDNCQFKTNQFQDLVKHTKIHSEKQLKCKECNFSCHHHHHLIVHMRTHTKETPYPCQLCSYKGKTSTHLKSHQSRLHSAARGNGKSSYSKDVGATTSFACKKDGCNFVALSLKSLALHHNNHELPRVLISKI